MTWSPGTLTEVPVMRPTSSASWVQTQDDLQSSLMSPLEVWGIVSCYSVHLWECEGLSGASFQAYLLEHFPWSWPHLFLCSRLSLAPCTFQGYSQRYSSNSAALRFPNPTLDIPLILPSLFMCLRRVEVELVGNSRQAPASLVHSLHLFLFFVFSPFLLVTCYFLLRWEEINCFIHGAFFLAF